MDSSNPAATIAAFLAAIHADETLQRRLRLVTTAEGLSELAAAAGYPLEPAQLVKHYAQLLVTADDAKAVHNFDLCGWDAGELLWLLKNWDD